MKKIAIITGASSGMGEIFAKTLNSHGQYDEVWAIARNKEKLDSLRAEVSFPLKPVPMDLSKPDFAVRLKELLEQEKPTVSLLINCAGYGIFEAFENTSLEKNIGMIDLNCRALTAMCYLALPYMTAGSEIINIASVAAFQPIPYINIYGASKAYVLSFSRALNREVRGRGIRVFTVCPFWTKTAFFSRAIDSEKPLVVKKYAAMYEPEYIVNYAWKAIKHKHKDYCIPGFIAKAQVFLVKILPHSLVMSIWQRQQGLK